MLVRTLLLCSLLIAILPSAGVAQRDECSILDTYPSGCRDFISNDSSNAEYLYFSVSVYPSPSQAKLAFSEGIKDLGMTRDSANSRIYKFGDEQATTQVHQESKYTVAVFFRKDAAIALYLYSGGSSDGLTTLYWSLLTVSGRQFDNTASGSVMKLLPTANDVPAGFIMSSEKLSKGVASSIPPTPAPEPSQTSDAGSNQILSLSGTGTNTSKSFTVPGDWDLTWSYDCSNFGMSGNFIVFIYQSSGQMSIQNLPVNQLGGTGSGTEHYHAGGNFYLQIISECSWSISLVS